MRVLDGRLFGVAILAVTAVVRMHPAQPHDAVKPVFTKDVAPILQSHCIQCHRAGGIASTAAFTNYESVRTWSTAIKEAVSRRQMPPWSADPEHSVRFRNDARLSATDIHTVSDWVDAGSPEGDRFEAVNLAAAAAAWHGPNDRAPDLVVAMQKAAQIPAAGDLHYVRFLSKVPLAEDRWVAACQARPGNASVVHHMAITEVELPNGVSPADVDTAEQLAHVMGQSISLLRPAVTSVANGLADMLAIYTPGSAIEIYPEGTGRLLKGGSSRYLDFNVHYTSNGRVSTDRSEVAFWFRDTPPDRQILRATLSDETILADGRELLRDAPGEKAEGTKVAIPPIPPGAANFELTAVTAFTRPVTLYQFHPHAHMRAKDFRFVVVFPDGREQVMLTVPRYDFRWQMAYELETPLRLAAGSKLIVTAHYDNSTNNKFNPAPDQPTYFRAQNMSTDEMFSPFVQFAEDATAPKAQVVQLVGCLTAPRPPKQWLLTQASQPAPVEMQSTDSASLVQSANVSLGHESFQLLGIEPFDAAPYQRGKVAVRGVLMEKRVNVTSLQAIHGSCGN